ncbi:LptE family protein [Desulfobacterales bacterium HSG17]|nr:LptE family protein [Desulfobacterales bacterium HSG17]
MKSDHKKLLYLAALTLSILLILTSCGYKFAGQGTLPSGLTSIHIAIFENHSAEIATEHIFTNDLISEFTKNGIKITNRKNADAVLTGVIDAMRISTVSRKNTSTSLERKITYVVSTSLADINGNTIWSDSNISEDEAYNVLPEKAGTAYGKKTAVSSISKRIAQDIYDRMTQEF